MKKLCAILIAINFVLLLIIVSMYNTTITWEHNGKLYTYKLGHFYTENIGLKHE